MKNIHALLYPSVLVLMLVLSGCQPQPPLSAEASVSKEKRDPMAITANDELVKQIKVGLPKMAQVAGKLRVAGRVEANEMRMARVSSPVSGRVVELEVVEGQHVKRGQVIAVVHSTELSAAQSGFLKAESQRRLAERAVERAKRLLDAGVIGEAELQRRDAELVQATAEFSSWRDQLQVLGMSQEALHKLETTRTVNSHAQVLATIDGTVMDRKVTIGQVVQAAEVTFLLADLSSVWLVADIPEQSAGSIEVGKHVEAEIAALPGIPIRGKLTFVSATVNPETRTVRVRMDLPNPGRRYKPAMLATMFLKDGSQTEQVVPITAVVRENNRDYLFFETGPSTFVMRPVELAGEYDNRYVVASRLGEGEKIVLDGAFHLNNERKRLATQGD